jgi:hypothetical protein
VHARWVHDVLLVSRGLALVRFAAVPVAGPDPAEPATVTKLGPAPVVAWFHLDDGTTIVAAANSEDDVRLLGPLPTQCSRPTTADTRTRSAWVYRCGGRRREAIRGARSPGAIHPSGVMTDSASGRIMVAT